MVRDDLYISIPSFFRCPISLDVMKSPVSLSTGVTYDRSSIQTWLDNGNNTCPATMQVLQSKEFVPNHTLHRLIQIWSNSAQLDRVDSVPPPPLSKDQARNLVKEIVRNPENTLDSLKKLVAFVKESAENGQFLVKLDAFLQIIVRFLGNANVNFSEQVVQILSTMLNEESDNNTECCQLVETILKQYREFSSSILLVLQQQSTTSLDSKISSASVLKRITQKATESNLVISENDDLLPVLFNFLNPQTDLTLLEEILSCLILLTSPKKVKVKALQLGIIKSLGKLLSDKKLNPTCMEKVLKLLETVSYCEEARNEICGDTKIIAEILGKVLKVSKAATEHAVKILWNACYVYRDLKAQEAVAMNNGLTKILLLLQSDCSPVVQLMSTDLLKIFRVYSKSCLSGYDTKNSHIMPF